MEKEEFEKAFSEHTELSEKDCVKVLMKSSFIPDYETFKKTRYKTSLAYYMRYTPGRLDNETFDYLCSLKDTSLNYRTCDIVKDTSAALGILIKYGYTVSHVRDMIRYLSYPIVTYDMINRRSDGCHYMKAFLYHNLIFDKDAFIEIQWWHEKPEKMCVTEKTYNELCGKYDNMVKVTEIEQLKRATAYRCYEKNKATFEEFLKTCSPETAKELSGGYDEFLKK